MVLKANDKRTSSPCRAEFRGPRSDYVKQKYDACRRQIYRPISKRNRRTTAQQVANQFLAASGKQISRKTVVRRLRGGGLYARRPVVLVSLTRQHRTARLQWCREHHNWTEQDWACVLFSDESRLSLSSDCRRQLIWRESGTAYRPENIQEKDRYATCSIMVWAGIMINGRTRLHVVANGTMTGQRYIDEVLHPHVRLFRGAVGDKFVFMDDNAPCHRTLAIQDCLDSEGIQRLVWLARSPDLNPIENVWDALGMQVAGRNYPPRNKNTLIRALTEEWDKLPQQLLDNVVQSMDEVEKLAYQLNEEAERTERPIRRLSKVMYGSTCADMQEQLSGGSVVVVHEEPHPQMTGTLSYRLDETGGRQREKSLDTRHRRLDDRYRVLSLSEDCTRAGSRNHPSNIIERDRYGGRGVLVWGGIMLGSRTDLHIFDAGSVNETRYCNENLLPDVRLFRGAMGLQFLFMDDNAPRHRTVAAEQLLESEDIERMDWPARSPDLNPIEHVWDFLGRHLAARTLPPVTIRELRLALQDEWAAMPQ
ncbi:transposable element Tcb2 transposase [Trichonephila clavipes]|uniref:Transposable element Tcb2 transposase n=1 Tax=Trichonephila clavipes TaxID=2585209 RepID=A0A8X6WDA9_TRICX|nr:transposable element Tcb2 transposase [Trichonephila clavipes]